MTSTEKKRQIKQLVLSGGNVWGFSMLGILLEAIQTGFLHMDDIQTIHATSVGSLVGVVVSLKIEPQLIRDYFIKRPWDSLCKKNRYSILDIYDEKGIVHRGFLENLFSPLFKSIELPVETTLKELYEYNGIDFHIYTTELNTFTLVDISFKTHPDWSVIDTIHASCAVPLLFKPFIHDGKCYIDGGFLLNYPITKCKCENLTEVLGISLGNISEDQKEPPISHSSNIFDFIFSVLFNVIKCNSLFKNDNSLPFPYQIQIYNKTTLDYFLEVLYTKEERERLVTMGNQTFQNLYKKWNTNESIHLSQTESNSAL
jgi:predicted acylesterase/phospholipase RssA